MYPLRLFFALILILFAENSFATECQSGEYSDSLIVDPIVPQTLQLHFPNEENIQPDISNFEIISAVTMSNEDGERWATLAIVNSASGRRTLSSRHLMAIFADGSRHFAQNVEHTFNAREEVTLPLFFGCSKFPILKLVSRQ